MATVTEMPPAETAEQPQLPAETSHETAPPVKNKGGRPPRGTPQPPDPKFFDQVAAVAREDWGTRAFMYVYADEPVCNPKTFGTTRYMLKSSKPILDLEMLKQDYGSFKGWMSLNKRKTGKDQTDEVDRFDFEIYDPKFPPKIPKSAWANDPRNKRWLDLLPPEKPPASEAVGTMFEAMKMYKEIRTEVQQESPAATETPTRTSEVLETMKAAKELFAPAAHPGEGPAADPFDTAAKIMQMRANDPMIAMLMQRMEAMDKAAEAARQREYELQKELRQMQTNPGSAPKGLLEQLSEMTSVKDKLKEFLGLNGDSVASPSRKTSPWDFAREVIPQVINSEFFAGIGQKIAATAITTPQTNPAMSPQQTPANSAADNGEAAFQRWIRDVVNKQVIRYFLHMGLDGDDLADVLYATEPEWTLRLQQFEIPQLPGMKGKEAILAGYRATQSVWPQIQQSGRAVEFETFVQQFCEWTPDTKEPPDDGVIDLGSESEASNREEDRA